MKGSGQCRQVTPTTGRGTRSRDGGRAVGPRRVGPVARMAEPGQEAGPWDEVSDKPPQ